MEPIRIYDYHFLLAGIILSDEQLIYKVMELEKFPTIYMVAMHQLTGSGSGRVFANSILGPAFSIGCGTGQGDPPSAG